MNFQITHSKQIPCIKISNLKRSVISWYIILLLFLSKNLFAQVDTLYSWDFETKNNTEGWQPTHSLSAVIVENGNLKTSITGSDPYMNGPGGLQIDAAEYGYIVIRMRVTHDTNAEFFWTTTAQPNFVAGLEFGFKLIADGEFHEYEVPVGNSDKWQGIVTRLRLDPGEGSARAVAEGAIVEIDYIRVVHLGPRLEFITFAVDCELIFPAEVVGLSLLIKNSGDEVMTQAIATLELDEGLNLIDGELTTIIPDIDPNNQSAMNWKISASDTGTYLTKITVSKNDQLILSSQCLVKVTPTVPAFPPEIPASAQVWSPIGDHWLLENSHVRLAFIKSIQGYGPIIVYTPSGNGWQQIGVIQPPGEFAYQSNASAIQHIEIFSQSINTESNDDSASIELLASHNDVDGVQWNFHFRFVLTGTGADQVKISYTATVSESRLLLHFAGPIIRAGEGSFNAFKQEALFPGLEWLIDDEESSSALDVHPPNDKRYLPHPYKVTIPIMSVSDNNRVIGMIWDPLKSWAGNDAYPSPLFASPNSWEGQKNHLMGLVVPPVGKNREENMALASKPYLIDVLTPINLQAKLFMIESNEQLAGLKWWLGHQGIASLPAKPRSYEDDIRLNCESFMDVLWEASAKGWHMALPDPWGPMSDHSVANQVWLGALYSDNAQQAIQWRDQMRQLAQKLLVENHQPAALGWDFAFRYGELDQVWGPLKNWASGHSSGQTADGGWLYSGDPALQNEGETSLGTCAMKTYVLLQAARITGDEFCRQRGLAGLEFMKQFRVPRGAQTWEVPLHAPDILAAAHAVMAYTEGYQLTDQTAYLNEAVRWAYAGLPFVYRWAAHDRPIMAYGSIPVFGATWYTGPWFGNIVQWNGLDYAYALLKIWQYDQSLPWKQIAEGLTICGMQMQRTSQTAYPQNKGMYPDAYSAVNGDEAYHWDLAPAKIMQNVLWLTGLDPDVYTYIIPLAEGQLHINGGLPFSAQLRGNSLFIHPFPVFPDSAFFLTANVIKPEIVLAGGIELPQVDDVDDVQFGWSYSLDGNVIIKIFVTDSISKLEIRPISCLPKYEQPHWEFNNDGYGDGWFPNFDVTELQIADGFLKAKSVGDDPWLTSPTLEINATDYDSFVVKLRVDKGNHAQLFWSTKDEPFFTEKKSFSFSPVVDGNYHICRLPLQVHDAWKGSILQLRFDPTNQGGAEFAIDFMRLIRSQEIDVQHEPSSIPFKFELQPNYPNPFNRSTQFEYFLPQMADVELIIYDILGRKVVEFSQTKHQSGPGFFWWNGHDEHGNKVSTGVYFCQLIMQSKQKRISQVRKLVLLQ